MRKESTFALLRAGSLEDPLSAQALSLLHESFLKMAEKMQANLAELSVDEQQKRVKAFQQKLEMAFVEITHSYGKVKERLKSLEIRMKKLEKNLRKQVSLELREAWEVEKAAFEIELSAECFAGEKRSGILSDTRRILMLLNFLHECFWDLEKRVGELEGKGR